MNDRIISATDEITRFAPSKLPKLKKGDSRYKFDHSHEAIEFIGSVDALNALDDDRCMVLRLSHDLKWVVDFEKKYPEAQVCKSNPPASAGSQADYAQ